MISNRITLYLVLVVLGLTAACATTQDRLLEMSTGQVELRSVQTRAFDTSDRLLTLRAVVATLQDLGFMIERADATIGVVSAVKNEMRLGAFSPLKITVAVRAKGERQMLVRASAEFRSAMVTDPKPYQNFFGALEKAMFLAAQNVD